MFCTINRICDYIYIYKYIKSLEVMPNTKGGKSFSLYLSRLSVLKLAI